MVIFSLSPLRARKSNNYRYRDSCKSDNFREKNHQKRSKEMIPKWMTNKIKRDNFTRSNREKYNIAIALLEK